MRKITITVDDATSLSARRAWIEIVVGCAESCWLSSLSARRAWIEISGSTKPKARREVALRKESVDRNSQGTNTILSITASLSARRAWIEIPWLDVEY